MPSGSFVRHSGLFSFCTPIIPMKIGGLDVSRNWGILCVLENFPDTSPSGYFQSLKTVGDWHRQRITRPINEIMYRVECNRSGVELLASLNLDAIVMEPTGGWYSAFWFDTAKSLGISVFWVSHAQVKYSRRHYGFKNKDDRSDAFTIALLYFDKGNRDALGNPPFFKKYDHESIEAIREKIYEREQIDKNCNTLINQLRMRLNREFPEIARRDFESIGAKGVNPTLGHIVESYKNPRFPKATAGTGISEFSKILAGDIVTYQERLAVVSDRIFSLTTLPEFAPYHRILSDFGYRDILGLMLIHVYPFDRFLVNGKPYRQNGHDLSLRKFQAFLGLSYSHESSGDTSATSEKVSKRWAGSEIVRAHLYAHKLTTICNPKYLARSPVQERLKEAWFNGRVDPKTGERFRAFKPMGKDGICRMLFYETRLLYQELKREFLPDRH